MQVPALRLVLANKKKRRHSRKKVKKIRLKLRLKNPRKLRPKVRQKRLRQLPKTRNASLNKTNRLRQRPKKQKNQRQPAMQVRRQTNRKKKKKPISNQPRANAPVRNMRPRHAKLKIGGVQNCTRCKQICSYGHQCPSCKRTFHNFCMLSLQLSTSKMCIACFEKSNASLKVLDSHLHDPYSPGKFIPYHPFTKHYATARSIQLHTKVCLPHIFSWGVCL